MKPEQASHDAVQIKGRIRAALINLQLLRHPRSEPELYDAARFPSTIILIRNVFRWLALVLLAYVAAAVLAKPDLGEVLRGTFIPTIQFNRDFLTMIVAVIGTTLSAYIYSWQSNEEVEEKMGSPDDLFKTAR